MMKVVTVKVVMGHRSNGLSLAVDYELAMVLGRVKEFK